MLSFIVSFLYPKRCVRCKKWGEYICDDHFSTISFLSSQLCAVCQKGSIDGLTHPKCRTKFGIDGIISSISYKGIVKKLLYQFKYPPYLKDLKGILGRFLYEGLIQQESFISFTKNNKIVIIPVPLHREREKRRGYNQSQLLAYELSSKLNIPLIKDMLLREKMTAPQFKLKKEEREKNILGAFCINTRLKDNVKGLNIILVDDIATTGSTLRECAKILKKGGAAKVIGVTLAHEA